MDSVDFCLANWPDAINGEYNPKCCRFPKSCSIEDFDSLSPERQTMLETMKYIRKPFNIDAVQVTGQNLQEVAKWVDGDIRTDDLGQYVKVRVHRPLNERQTKAYVGDWVLYAGTGYKVYTQKAFSNSFEQVSGESVMIDTNIKRTDGDPKLSDSNNEPVVSPKHFSKTPVKTT